ncbi:MAG: diacylglycerol kinase family protein [Aestuariibaculum sp.]
MRHKKESFARNRIKSVGYAFKGALLLIKTESSIKVQFSIAILVTIAGFFFNISATEWMFQILAIALVLGIEGINTTIEEIADFIHPEHHKKIGKIKDIAAGAVFIAAIFAIIIGLIIYIPKIFKILQTLG